MLKLVKEQEREVQSKSNIFVPLPKMRNKITKSQKPINSFNSTAREPSPVLLTVTNPTPEAPCIAPAHAVPVQLKTVYDDPILQANSSKCVKRSLLRRHSHHPERLWVGDPGLDVLMCFRATSAASSFALLTWSPSYQNLAGIFWPCTVTVLDQAVRPPV